MNDIVERYKKEVRPEPSTYITVRGKEAKTLINTRGEKSTRYAFWHIHKDNSVEEKICYSVELLMMALQREFDNGRKPVVSCSFGIDSMITLWLTRMALWKLDRKASDIDVVWNDTKNEFPEVRKFAKRITEEWDIRLIQTSPKKMLMKVISDYGEGGKVSADYFTDRKGKRGGKKPLSEKCCGSLKHEPMRRAIKEHKWSLVINGIRGDESSQRKIAGLRDGEYFYSKVEWKAFVARPILWWTEEDIWECVTSYGVPYCEEIYEKNLIQKYPQDLNRIVNENRWDLLNRGVNVELLLERQIQTVGRRQAILLKRIGFTVFDPRVGCQMCPIPVKYGYLQWMRVYYPKTYDAMIHKLGYGAALISLLPDEVKEDIELGLGIELTDDNINDILKDMLEYRPCTFDNLKKK